MTIVLSGAALTAVDLCGVTDMPKRAERRHHETRIKEKFKKVAARWAGSVGSWIQKRWVPAVDGSGRFTRMNTLDMAGGAKRMKHIEETAAKLAHHSKCDCGMCHKDRYRTSRHRERVLDKIYIEEGKDNGKEE